MLSMYPLMKVCGREIKVQGKLIRIARLEAEKYEFLDNPVPLPEGLRKSGMRIDLFTFMQKITDTLPKYHYPMEWDNLAALQVSTYNSWWNQQIDCKTRNMVRRADKKGVATREVPFNDVLVRGIWEIYNEPTVRQGTPFPHYGKDIEWVRKHAATFLASSIFIGAFFDGKLIGFVKLTSDETRTQAGMMHIISMAQHRDKAPTNALIAQSVRSCADRGISFLVYSNFSYGKKQRDSLSDFKKNNGFQKVDLPRYYIPLTRIGWAAFHMGLHHRFADHLPESMASKLREFRKAWNTRKFQPAKEA
jgi:hypothetical protein